MNELNDCSAFVAHLRAEHRRLHAGISRIERDWAAADPGGDPATLLAAVRELRRELSQHFDEEEEGGCLEEAVSRCPRFGPEADRIEREHPVLLEELDEILSDLAVQPGPALNELHKRFKRLVRKLHAHEAAENRLLGEAFGEPVE